MTAIITGSNGFTGTYLTRFLKEHDKNITIYGLDIDLNNNNPNVDTYFSIHNYSDAEKKLERMEDETIFYHLGGVIGNKSLPELVSANVYWTSKYLSLASLLKNLKLFLNIGSSAEYGKQKVETLDELLITNPVSNYGISKDIQAKMILRYGEIFNLPVLSTRTFNLIGPGLTSSLVVGKIINEFEQIKSGKKGILEMGRTDSKRDFIDVRDAVKIYYLLTQSTLRNIVVNVARGESIQIAEILQICSLLFEVNPTISKVYQTEKIQDIDYQYANLELLIKHIGNYKFIPLEQSLKDMMNFKGFNQ